MDGKIGRQTGNTCFIRTSHFARVHQIIPPTELDNNIGSFKQFIFNKTVMVKIYANFFSVISREFIMVMSPLEGTIVLLYFNNR